MTSLTPTSGKKWRWLPEINSKGYYLLLALVATFILGPLGGITAAYMNFSLGFFVGGQVLAGILGSAITYGYGSEGKHGANYMQTMAASVASMSGMCVLIQAMIWLGLPEPPAWQLVLYYLCIGMFGCGVGMLYTPVIVDKMNLMFPSGFAVANILRALTDINLLKRSIRQLGGGTLIGLSLPIAALKLPIIDSIGISTSTIGAGMVVGARIGLAGTTTALLGWLATPYLRSIGWLDKEASFRKIGFILALGTIMGAAIVDMTLIGVKFVKQLRNPNAQTEPVEAWKQTDTRRLLLWVAFWGAALYFVSTEIMHTPALYTGIAIGLVFLFVMINGISTGISDSNPISSAFVVTVFILAAIGLKDAGVGLLAAAILLVACSVGVDMQQDRSTGWRLGTNRTIQFRFQVLGIIMGAVLAVVLARVFMNAYPVLRIDQFTTPHPKGAEGWGSAMTFKFVGALKGLTDPKAYTMTALKIGIGVGLAIEVLRKLIKGWQHYKSWTQNSKVGFATDFALDTFLLPSPYASSFGGFVELPVAIWYGAGSVISSLFQTAQKHLQKDASQEENGVPEDMSTTSLFGGGLIAGDSLAALGIGIYGLLSTLL